MRVGVALLGCAVACVVAQPAPPGDCAGSKLKREMTSYLSDKAVTLDGVINLEEWSDATVFSSVDKGENMWLCEFYAPKDPEDLSLVAGYVKHTHDALYFAFNVTDNLNYGVDTPRWKPKGNPNSDLLNASGWPFFGDEMEILINAEGAANPSGGDVAGNETSWQLVANTVAARCRHSGRRTPTLTLLFPAAVPLCCTVCCRGSPPWAGWAWAGSCPATGPPPPTPATSAGSRTSARRRSRACTPAGKGEAGKGAAETGHAATAATNHARLSPVGAVGAGAGPRPPVHCTALH
jgi:hypothetical protein